MPDSIFHLLTEYRTARPSHASLDHQAEVVVTLATDHVAVSAATLVHHTWVAQWVVLQEAVVVKSTSTMFVPRSPSFF